MAAQDSITHFSHPGHELVKRHYIGSFRCDMCWEDLTGAAYGCSAGCDFTIHESCAAHPQTYFCPVHEPQPYFLVQTRHDAAIVCDVCKSGCAPGSFLYHCPPCGYNLHPRCTALPRAAVRSSRHPEHDLTLTLIVAEEGSSCAACRLGAGRPARPWCSYRCETCKIDFHVSCAAGGGGEEVRNAGNAHAPVVVTQVVASDAEEALRRARIRQADLAIARANASLNRMSWIV